VTAWKCRRRNIPILNYQQAVVSPKHRRIGLAISIGERSMTMNKVARAADVLGKSARCLRDTSAKG
jgi:hypothetical protein